MKTTSDRQSNWSAPSRHGAAMLLIALGALAFANFATAAIYTWDDGGAGSNWSTDANWNPDGAPPADSSAHTLLFDATAPGTSVMDGNYTVGTLSYTADGHTTDLNSNNTLTPGAISFANNNTHAVVQNGNLVLGQSGSPISLTVGTGESRANRTQSLTLSGLGITAYLSSLSLGVDGFQSRGYGTLDLSGATLAAAHGGVLEIPTLKLAAGGNSGSGSLLFTASTGINHLKLGSLDFRNGQLGENVGGVYKLPSNTSLTIGTSGSPTALVIGQGGGRSTGTASVIMTGGTFEAYLSSLSLGVDGFESRGYGTLDLSGATLAAAHGGVLEIPTLNMAADGYSGSGSLLFTASTGINHLKLGSLDFRNGSLGENVGGVYKLPSNTSLTIGTSGSPTALVIGHGGSRSAGSASVIMTGGAFTAYLSSVSLGAEGFESGGQGTLDLSAATLAAVHNRILQMDTLLLGGRGGKGVLVFTAGTGIDHLVVKGNLTMKSGGLGQWDAGAGAYKLPSNTSLTIGQSGTPVNLVIGQTSGSRTVEDGRIIMTGGLFTAHLNDLTVGDRASVGSDSGSTTGTLDLSGADSVSIVNIGGTKIASGTSSRSTGTVKLPVGTVSTGTLSLGSGGTGILDLAGTTFSFTDTGASAVSIGATGTLIGHGKVSGAGTFTSTGFVRADTGTLDLTGLTGAVSISRLYAQNGGTLALPGTTMTVTTLDVGATGGGTVNLNGTAISMGANNVTVASSGALTGHGSISGNTLTMNGTVRASGGTLDLSGFTTVASSSGSGWLVENGGAITLPARNVAAGDGGDFIWGARASAVHSVQLDFTGVTGGDLSITVLDPDTLAFLPEGTLGSIVSLWEIDELGVFNFGSGSVDMVFRYDDSRLASLGIGDESLLRVFHYTGSVWEELITEINTTAHTATVRGVRSFSPFAVGLDITNAIIPEPASLALFGLAGAGLMMRRRRRA